MDLAITSVKKILTMMMMTVVRLIFYIEPAGPVCLKLLAKRPHNDNNRETNVVKPLQVKYPIWYNWHVKIMYS